MIFHTVYFDNWSCVKSPIVGYNANMECTPTSEK